VGICFQVETTIGFGRVLGGEENYLSGGVLGGGGNRSMAGESGGGPNKNIKKVGIRKEKIGVWQRITQTAGGAG